MLHGIQKWKEICGQNDNDFQRRRVSMISNATGQYPTILPFKALPNLASKKLYPNFKVVHGWP